MFSPLGTLATGGHEQPVPRSPIDPTVRMAEVTDEPIHHVYYGYDRTECEIDVEGV